MAKQRAADEIIYQRLDWGSTKPVDFKTIKGTPYNIGWTTTDGAANGHTLFYGPTHDGMSRGLFAHLPDPDKDHPES